MLGGGTPDMMEGRPIQAELAHWRSLLSVAVVIVVHHFISYI
jgi:hypothetical protein